jgi:CheY-like chemotaxis protein
MQTNEHRSEPVRGRAVLVVDDDDDIRSAVQEVLEEEGFETIGAANGKQALEVARICRR